MISVRLTTRADGPHGGVTHRTCGEPHEVELTAAHGLLLFTAPFFRFIYVSVLPDGCQTKVDLMFVLDYSGSIASAGYETEKKFAKDVVSFFDIGPDASRVASISYGTTSRTDFDFNRYTTKESVLAGIGSLTYVGGGTATDIALRSATALFTSTSSGVRPQVDGVPKICVVLTDGGSNNKPYTIRDGNLLKDKSVNIFAIGAGSVNEAELKAIASEPIVDHYYKLDSVKDIPSLVNKMASFSCNEPAAVKPGDPVDVDIEQGDYRYGAKTAKTPAPPCSTINVEGRWLP